mgnify:CR=1 FL=1
MSIVPAIHRLCARLDRRLPADDEQVVPGVAASQLRSSCSVLRAHLQACFIEVIPAVERAANPIRTVLTPFHYPQLSPILR